MRFAAAAALAAAVALAGCGSGGPLSPARPSAPPTVTASLPPDYVPVPTGRGPRFRLPAAGAAASAGRTIRGLDCRRRHPPSFLIHLELYAERLVLPVPAGIGVAAPLERRGAYVLGGRCTYPIRSLSPTGLVRVDGGRPLNLADLFAIWGQPLGGHRLAGFTAPVNVVVDGRRATGEPGAVRLDRHAEIVVVSGGGVLAHARYGFPPSG